jgi:peptide/nickel transport system ATP-binding protein
MNLDAAERDATKPDEAEPNASTDAGAPQRSTGQGTTTATTLGPSLDRTTIEEIAPAADRRRREPRGERPLLEVSGLRTSFATRDGIVRAVDGISFNVDRGEIMGLVGESGCGKSVTSLSIMRLVPPPGRIEAGTVVFEGRDLLTLRPEQMRSIRGQQLAMVFQQPTSSLNPVWDVGRQIGETLEIHRGMRRKDARKRALELLQLVGIPDPERRLRSYPHELSGGMAQRVMIAMALACEPDLLIADEPTTALDVTIQAQILDLLRNLRDELGTAIILITHDLGVVAEMCDRVAVMYAGEIVEQTEVGRLFRDPRHPYTRGLIGSIPVPGDVTHELAVIPGNVPNLIDLPSGCRFAPRCLARVEEDVTLAPDHHPELRPVESGHEVRCWLWHDVDGGLLPGPPGRRGPVAMRVEAPEIGLASGSGAAHTGVPA